MAKPRFGRSLGSEWGNIPSSKSITGGVIKDVLRMGGKYEKQTIGNQPTKTAMRSQKEIQARANMVYTPEQIAGNEYLSTMKNALSTLTYEQALANYRKLVSASNLIPLSGTNVSESDTAKTRKALSAINSNPLLKYAENIFFAMGGSYSPTNPKSAYGGAGLGQVNTRIYKSLGLNPPTTKYAPVGGVTYQRGNNIVTNLVNPLSAMQRTRLKRLRSISPRFLTERQKAALARLRAKKNAPTIIP